MKTNKKLTAIVLTKNEEERIKKCLESVLFTDEVIVIDDESTDKTREVAKSVDATVFTHKKKDFADQRNFGLSKATGEWVFYIDADEIVSKKLAEEIQTTISVQKSDIIAYKIPRQNYYLGKKWPHIEKLERLFKKSALKGWFGEVHESPEVQGKMGDLKNFIIHTTHRNFKEMVAKTNSWSEIEARLRYNAGHPKISWWRFPRLMLSAFFSSYIKQGGWKVGTVGLIESMYQAFSIFITYARLWEMQQKDL